MTMMDRHLAHLNQLSPADRHATPWVATPDGSWTRRVGAGVNPDFPLPIKPSPAKKEAPEGAVPRGIGQSRA